MHASSVYQPPKVYPSRVGFSGCDTVFVRCTPASCVSFTMSMPIAQYTEFMVVFSSSGRMVMRLPFTFCDATLVPSPVSKDTVMGSPTMRRPKMKRYMFSLPTSLSMFTLEAVGAEVIEAMFSLSSMVS